jgi:hypothetical protein
LKTFVSVLLSSSAFGFLIAIVYWFVSREPAGTILLGIVGIALAFATAWAVIAEREAGLVGDRESGRTPEYAGEEIGIFTGSSGWPPLVAVCALGVVLGLMWSPLVAAASSIGMLLCLWRLGAESNRT